MKSSLESGRVIQLTVVRHEGSRGRVVVSWTAATAAASTSTAVTLQPLSGTVCHSASFYTFQLSFPPPRKLCFHLCLFQGRIIYFRGGEVLS